MRSTPARRMAASNTSSPPTIDPVWKAKLSSPSDARPVFITTTGFTRAAARRALIRRLASSTASRYSMMLSVAPSWVRKSRISPKLMSSPTPVEMTVENPTRRARAQSSVAAHRAPDCETSARRPGPGISPPTVAFKRRSVLTTPRLLGPRNRMPWRRAVSIVARSSCAPSSPPSRNPAAARMAPRMPRSPHCCRTSGVAAAGVTRIARSTGCGRSRTPG